MVWARMRPDATGRADADGGATERGMPLSVVGRGSSVRARARSRGRSVQLSGLGGAPDSGSLDGDPEFLFMTFHLLVPTPDHRLTNLQLPHRRIILLTVFILLLPT